MLRTSGRSARRGGGGSCANNQQFHLSQRVVRPQPLMLVIRGEERPVNFAQVFPATLFRACSGTVTALCPRVTLFVAALLFAPCLSPNPPVWAPVLAAQSARTSITAVLDAIWRDFGSHRGTRTLVILLPHTLIPPPPHARTRPHKKADHGGVEHSRTWRSNEERWLTNTSAASLLRGSSGLGSCARRRPRALAPKSARHSSHTRSPAITR